MQRDDWHLDQKIIVALIGAVGALLAHAIFWTYVATSWKDQLESRVMVLEKSDDNQQSHEKRITILEQQFDFIRSDLAEIKSLLRRQIPPQP